MVDVPQDLLRKYDKPGPRYTSYPTVPVWTNEFGEDDYRQALATLATKPQVELCVYLHLPFCAKRCHYCGCNALSAQGNGTVAKYLDSVERELELLTAIFGSELRVVQLHWGGGTPNFLNRRQLRRAVELLKGAFYWDAEAEISLEADPRVGTPEQAALLRELGFNRISLGVQDFDPSVQKAIGRDQSEARTRRFYAACRETGFSSVNLDLVYGLPGQTRETFARTLSLVRELDPDRIACFSYAHVPWVRPNQEFVDTSRMPDPTEKFDLFRQSLTTLNDAGYEWIGMDHFARPTDELTLARHARTLHRNFMGYTTRPAADLLALGMSGISELADCFAQNSSDLDVYQDQISAGRLPIVRGHRLSKSDSLRRAAITHIMCNLELPFDLVADTHGIRLDEELASELERLEPLVDDGLLVREETRLRVTDLGRFFLRNICMELDAYLDQESNQPLFSRTV